jgi:Uma2 family endonuclease
MKALVEELARAPQLPLYIQELQDILAAERARREEFYDTVTEDEKAEFINGEVIVQSPVKLRHNRVSKLLLRLLDTYVDGRDLGFVGHEKIMVSLTLTDYEPDICFFRHEVADTLAADQMHFPAPDLVVEVLSESTEAIDRGIKMEDYAAHGVGEYWLIDPDREVVEQYTLQDDVYELRLKSGSGEITSTTLPGFTIPIRAIFDTQINLTTLQTLVQDE